MLNLTPNHIIKYLSVAIIVAIILFMIPGEKLEMRYIVTVAFAAALFSFILDLLYRWYRSSTVSEHMEAIPELKKKRSCVRPSHYSDLAHDYYGSYLNGSTQIPGYYLINNGRFSEAGMGANSGTVSYGDADELIKESKLHVLYNQHNYNILTSPHTHIGKNRGYLNWDPVYE